MSKATPGPWHLWVDNEGAFVLRGKPGENGMVIARRTIGTPNAAEGIANARLIAAAPDLLDMLQQYDEAVVAGTQCFFCATSPHLSRCGLTELIRRAGGDLAPEGEVQS